jgi:hypothetical protein
MSGFSESLSLDVSQALRDIDRLKAQLTQAAQSFRSQALGALDDLRSRPLRLELDTAGVAAEVSRALDGADTSVDVDTSRVRSDIERAVPTEVDLPIKADTTRARTEIRRLGTEAESAAGKANLLRNALGAIGTAGVLAGVRSIADAFSDLQEQRSGSTVVFGDLAAEVQSFASNAVSIGLAADEALRASNSFGLMAQSAGLAQAAAADFATTIVARGADIASLRDLDLSETLQALQSGLAGETEPLRKLGAFLNAAEVDARALELGLVGLNGEVTEAAKIQARYSLILEKTSVAAGDYARTSESLANSQRSLAAEFQNVLSAQGADLEDEFVALLDAARFLVPSIDALASEALPSLLSILIDLAPVLGATLDIVTALTPALDLVADVVGAVPPELIALAGAAFAANQAIDALGSTGLARKLSEGFQLQQALGAMDGLSGAAGRAGAAAGTARVGIAGLATSLASVNPFLLAGGALLGTFAISALRASEEKRRFRAEVQEAAAALRDESGALQITTEAIAGYISETSRFSSAGLIPELTEIGLTVAEVADLALQGEEGFRQFLEAGIRLGAIDLTGFGDSVLASGEGLDRIQYALRGKGLIDAFRELQAVTAANAGAELDRIAGLSDTNALLVAQARASNDNADATAGEAAALAQVNAELERQGSAAAQVVATYQPLITATTGAADALTLVGTESENVRNLLRALRSGTQSGEGGMIDLALALGEAQLSTEGFAAAAALAGVDIEDLGALVEATTDTFDRFISTAISQLPTVSSVFSETFTRAQDEARALAETIRETDPIGAQAIEDAARVTADALRVSLSVATIELADFQNDLAALAASGFGTLSAMLAEQGSTAGNALADELADALAAGNLELLTGLQTAQATFEQQSQTTVDFLRNTLGPQLLSESALIGAALTNIIEGADPTASLEVAGRVAQLELDSQGRQIASVAALAGEDAARSYAGALNLEGPTVDAAVAAGIAIAAAAPVDEAFVAGQAVTQGFIDGLTSLEARLAFVTATLANSVPGRIEDQLAISSPSRVMMRLGGFVAEGFAVGMSDGASLVARSAETLANAALVNTSKMTLVGSPAGPGAAAGFDSEGLIAAVQQLAAKVGPTYNLNGGPAHRRADLREARALTHLGGW